MWKDKQAAKVAPKAVRGAPLPPSTSTAVRAEVLRPSPGHKPSFFDRDGDGKIDAIKAVQGFHGWRGLSMGLGVGVLLGFFGATWAMRTGEEARVAATAAAVGQGVAIGSAKAAIEDKADYGDDAGVDRGRSP